MSHALRLLAIGNGEVAAPAEDAAEPVRGGIVDCGAVEGTVLPIDSLAGDSLAGSEPAFSVALVVEFCRR